MVNPRALPGGPSAASRANTITHKGKLIQGALWDLVGRVGWPGGVGAFLDEHYRAAGTWTERQKLLIIALGPGLRRRR